MKFLRSVFLLILVVFCLNLLSFEAKALPQFAAEYGQGCFLCHVDPSGGGPRNLYGGQFYARTEMATKPSNFEQLEKFNPQINSWLTLGADLRVLHDNREKSPTAGDRTMQGAIHLTAQLDDKYQLMLSKDWEKDYQAEALAYILPWHGYIKAGRFTPNFGLRPDDHTLYIRREVTGMPDPRDVVDTGTEIGISPKGMDFTVGVSNGTTQEGNDDRHYAVTSHLAFRQRLFNQLNVTVGGSHYINDQRGVTQSGFKNDINEFWYGPFATFYWKDWSLMGEYDFVQKPTTVFDVNFSSRMIPLESKISTIMLTYRPYRGWYVRASHDYRETDLERYLPGDNAVPQHIKQRWSGGIQWFPYGFLELQGNLRMSRVPDGQEDAGKMKRLGFDAQVHVFF